MKKGISSKFDDQLKLKLEQLDVPHQSASWAFMLSKLQFEGLSDIEESDLDLIDNLSSSSDSSSTDLQADWGLFEEKLSSAESNADWKLDELVRSNLESVKPRLRNNSWDDFYAIYKGYIELRRSIYITRFFEVTYLGMIFLFLVNFNFDYFYKSDQNQNSNVESEIIYKEADNLAASQKTDVLNNMLIKDPVLPPIDVSNEDESSSIIKNSTPIFVEAEEQKMTEQIETSEEFSEEAFVRNIEVLSSDIFYPKMDSSIVKTKLVLFALLTNGNVSKKESIIKKYISLSFGQSIFLSTQSPMIGPLISDGLVDDEGRFVGLGFGLEKNRWGGYLGLNFRRDVSMGEVYLDAVRPMREVNILEIPVQFKMSLLNPDKYAKPYLRLGGAGSFVLSVDELLVEEETNGAKDKNAIIPGRNIAVEAADIEDFKKPYFSFDFGLGYEQSFSSGMSLFLDMDYKYYLNNYSTSIINPNYLMLNNLSVRVGGRIPLND